MSAYIKLSKIILACAVVSSFAFAASQESVSDHTALSQNIVEQPVLDIPGLDKQDPLHPLVSVCVTCHGVDGASQDNPSIPILAAQYPHYLKKQLENFAAADKGFRPNSLMEQFAQALSSQDQDSIAIYYSNLKKQWLETPAREDLAQGRRIYLGGVFTKKIPACSSCHSPTGFGNEPANYPMLASQHAEYLITQLQNYRSKARLHPIMNTVAKNLSDEEIEAVAYYLQGLRSVSK